MASNCYSVSGHDLFQSILQICSAWSRDCLAIKKYFHRITRHNWILDHEFIKSWGDDLDFSNPLQFNGTQNLENPRSPLSNPDTQFSQSQKTDDKPEPKSEGFIDQNPARTDSFSEVPDLSFPPDANLDDIFN